MISLAKSERFQKEYNEFHSKIMSIKDESIKNELNLLLLNLSSLVNNIDSYHTDFGVVNPTTKIADSREKLIAIRKKLVEKLEDCRRSGLI